MIGFKQNSRNNYGEWLDEFYGLMPHRTKHPGSFNNILFSTELILAKKELGELNKDDLANYLGHIHLTNTLDGLYAPKNSHDNLTAKIVGLMTLESGKLKEMNLSEARKRKHPRDFILYSFWLSNNILWSFLLVFPLLDIIRAIFSSGKIRPKFWDKRYFMLRLKAKFGLIEPFKEEEIFGGRAEHYMYNGNSERIIYVQNDGKILNLLRLYVLKQHKILKPFVHFCKWLYIKRYGKHFQSIIFSNYFEEFDHPVRDAFRALDSQGKTLLD